MTAGRNDNVSFFLCEYSFIFVFDDGCTDCGFFNIKEAELLKCRTHGIDARTVIVCNERGSKAHNNGITALDKHLCFFDLVHDFLCILRTHNKALTAENGLIAYNMRLIARKADSFDRAMADAFITVFAV